MRISDKFIDFVLALSKSISSVYLIIFENITQCSTFRQCDKISHHRHQNTNFINNGVFPKWHSMSWLEFSESWQKSKSSIATPCLTIDTFLCVVIENNFYDHLWEQNCHASGKSQVKSKFYPGQEIVWEFCKMSGEFWLFNWCQGNVRESWIQM